MSSSVFTDEQRAHKQYIIGNFDRALSENWIKVYYQPIVRSIDEKVCDEEALARWIDPEKGVIKPDGFIPLLEETGLIYKLDLYVLERVLEHIKTEEKEGLYVVPHSLNISRADFDSCDIVEEIRKRVDGSGVKRDRITIELTESTIGGNFEFMKKQVERFKSLGFPVWLDDFGSGYSSLDVLQSIRFDLLKFDMSFMKKLDASESGRIILTELMKLASALGIEAVCEGVETESQVKFLQEIGCAKLQGYYYQKPQPFSAVLEWHKNHPENGFENPEESEYYESIGRLNLYDLSVLAERNEGSIQKAFSTLPMGIIEIKGDACRFVRANQAYHGFIKRFFGFDLSELGSGFEKYDAAFMYNIVKTCVEMNLRSFYDEKMADGSVVHSFARKLSENPVNGNVAVAIAVLSITDPDESATYAEIARALAADYYNIYIIDLDEDTYIEYSSLVGGEELAMERHGFGFFESARKDTMTRIYEDDREMFLSLFTKENVLKIIDEQGVFSTTYRLIDTGTPMYVNMKVTRMKGRGNRLILGVSIVDSYMKQKEFYEELQKERDTLARVMALSDGYLSLFTIDLSDRSYVEFSSSDDFDSLGAAKQGEDFFAQAVIDAQKYFHPADVQRFIDRFTFENVLKEIHEKGSFRINYRLMINGEPKPVNLRAALFKEGGVEKMVVGIRAWQKRN